MTDLEELLSKPLPPIPEEIRRSLDGPPVTLTPFASKDDILLTPSLQEEVGYGRFPDGRWLVSMTCPMPGISFDMVDWWFWWHCREDIRYQAWFPGEHFACSWKKSQAEWFEADSKPPFQPNTKYPTERIGSMRMRLRIDFTTPAGFGFSEEAVAEGGVAGIVCGHVSILNGLVPNTEMAHIYFHDRDGLRLASRFWLGQSLPGLYGKYA